MRRHRIAVIPGDGIGHDVIAAGVRVLDAVAALTADFTLDYEWFPWGSAYYGETGRMMPKDGLERLAPFDAIYFGAVGAPTVPDHVSLWGLRLEICHGFDQYANVRPVKLLPGIESPLRAASPATIDWVIVRENTEGEYAGVGGRGLAGRGPDHQVAIQTSVFSSDGCERVMEFAFRLAESRARRKVTNVTKSNAQQYGMVLWDEVFATVAARHPGVATDRYLVDAMAAHCVLHPETLDVVVASNLFADILSDLGAATCGSLGLAASANLNPERRYPSMFEPVHGSAPDIAGRGIANPIGAVWSGALMLEHLGETRAARAVIAAIERLTAGGRPLTPDVGGVATTAEVTEALLACLPAVL